MKTPKKERDHKRIAREGIGLAWSVFQSCLEMELACGWLEEVRDYLRAHSRWTKQDQKDYDELMARLD